MNGTSIFVAISSIVFAAMSHFVRVVRCTAALISSSPLMKSLIISSLSFDSPEKSSVESVETYLAVHVPKFAQRLSAR